MLISINLLMQVIIITAGTFLIERYVMLEPPMEAKKQRIFYILCACTVMVSFFIIGDNAQYFALFFGALNILLGRKRHKILGAVMVIPLIGIINGAAAPIFLFRFLPQVFLGVSEDSFPSQLAMLAVNLIYVAAFVVFYFVGKKWRKWFGENMKDRSPSHSEHILTYVSGIVIMLFSGTINRIMAGFDSYSRETARIIGIMILFFECMAFLATVTVIVLVMQGNKRKFYHDRVEGMQFSVIATMADIVEDRDSNTGGHIKRTAKYVEIIGKYLLKHGEYPDILNKHYLEDMVVAAPLHDIGKICISDTILNKAGKLSDEEFEEMKKHASAGRDVLKKAEKQMGKFEYLEIAEDMAEYHHEWFNGKGYPEKISGEEIPLCARIMAVADVFDALTSKRCYKEAMPLEKAYGIISEESGTHFDPVVAQAFLNSKKEIEEAMKQLSEE